MKRMSFFTVPGLTLAVTLAGLTSSGCFLNTGNVRTARPAKNAPAILLGPIENRDPKFNGHLAQNFSDRLIFELSQQSLEAYPLLGEELAAALSGKDRSPGEMKTPRKPVIEPKKKTEKSKTEDDSDDDIPPSVEPTVMLPEKLRNLAGESQSDNIHPMISRLDREAIIRLAKAGGYKFFIQGAISRTEQGVLLDTKENSFVFLEIWSAEGRRVGLVNYAVHDRSLLEANLLDQVAPKIADAIAQTIATAPH